MIDEVKKVAMALQLKCSDFQGVKDAQGKAVKAVTLQHGQYQLFAIEQGTSIVLRMPIPPPKEVSEKLAQLPDEAFDRMMTVLNMELLHGRSAYSINVENKVIKDLFVEQKLILDCRDPECIQRFADGVQEVVIVGLRAINVLGGVYGSMGIQPQTSTSTSTYHEAMYT